MPPELEPRTISRELERLTAQLHDEFPHAEKISFDFDGKLHLHVDVRDLEEAHIIHSRLERLYGALYSHYFVGESPHHRFWHRVSAVVAA